MIYFYTMERPVVEMPFLMIEDADMKTINEILEFPATRGGLVHKER